MQGRWRNNLRKCNRASAFTLVEVMAVLAIVAVLAALVLPAISYCKASARRASCASNLHQIGVAMTMYVDDDANRYPVAADPDIHLNGCSTACWPQVLDTHSSLPTLQSVLAPYLHSDQVWGCPADTGNLPLEFPFAPYNSVYKKYGMSYLYDLSVALFPPNYDPANKAYLVDASPMWHGNFRGNYLFVDGHVEDLVDEAGPSNY